MYDIAIIGLGAMGSSALYAAAKRGLKVIGFDRAQPGHSRSSSYGESRIIRLSYFEDPAYVPLLRGAYRSWRALEAFTGERVLTVTGIVEAGYPGATLIEGSMRSAREHDIAHTLMTPGQINHRFPAFDLPSGWEAMHQPDGGVLFSEKAIDVFVAAATHLGAEARTQSRVADVQPSGDGVIVRLEDGTRVEAHSAIIAAGSWATELVPDLTPHLHLTRQPLIWFKPRDPALVSPERMPIFFFQSDDAMIYGFPNITGSGVKAASHLSEGDLDSADAPRVEVSEEEKRDLGDFLQRYVPAAAGHVTKTHVCVYTRTPDEHFLLGPHPDAPQIILASPCSGHGFKFASLLGEILTDLAHDRTTTWPIELFQTDRFRPTGRTL